MTITKKYFGTDGIRGKVGNYPIDAEFMLKLGWAVGRVFSEQVGNTKVIIGKDTRISGYMFEAALEAGLSAAGANCALLGPMPTPAIAYLTRTLRAQLGIVISASHNPYEDNGIKFFSSKGLKLPDELELAIENQLEKALATVDSANLGKAERIVDAPGRYIEFCKSTFVSDASLNGLKIVVDCANGATYHIAPPVFTELGADVIELATKPNGFNINDQCGSTQITMLQNKVKTTKADLGIAFDGDGDRVIMIDNSGEIVDGDELLFIMAFERQRLGLIKGGVVGTFMSNLGLEQGIRDLGLDFIRVDVGDRYVLAELLKQNWVLGGESSGHIINFDLTTTGDGIISALQVLKALCHNNCSLRQMKQKLRKYPQTLLNVRINGEANPLASQRVQQAITAATAQLAQRGRILVRPSGTEPLIRIMVEGQEQKEIEAIAQELANVIQKTD